MSRSVEKRIAIQRAKGIEIGTPKRVEVRRGLPGTPGIESYVVHLEADKAVTLYERYAKKEPIAVIEP